MVLEPFSDRTGLMDAGVLPENVGDGVRIQRASAVLGVPAATLRSWERRYGLPTTPRSPGGHRRYSDVALNELRFMRDEIGHGLGASAAARSVRDRLDPANPAAPRIHLLLAASRDRDAAALRAVLDIAEHDLGLAQTIDTVLLPAMRQIGTWWGKGTCDVAQEQFTSIEVRTWLARAKSYGPPTNDAPILLACGPQDLHTIGLEALAALLARQGQATRLLGPRVQQAALLAHVTRIAPSAVVVVSHLTSHRRLTVAALDAVANTGCLTFYAGNAFTSPVSAPAWPVTTSAINSPQQHTTSFMPSAGKRSETGPR